MLKKTALSWFASRLPLLPDQNKLTRRASLDGFRQGKICELLTTDVAARGLDVDQLGYVVNTEVPQEKESYLHRAGRGTDGK